MIIGQIAGINEGITFRYEDLGIMPEMYQAAAKALARMVNNGLLKRATKGVFYKPRKTIFGELRPSEEELLKIYLYQEGKRNAYVTGTGLYNRMGLTTQVPRTIRVASRDANIRTKIGDLRVLPAKSYVEVTDLNYRMLEILDAIKDLKKIPDLDIKNSIIYFAARISGMSGSEIEKLIQIALKYPPRVRAFLGAIISEEVAAPLKSSLNPLTVFKLGIGEEELPNAAKWNIE
jgi:hypothetical protein